jgi:hypothetical protein
VEFEQGVKCKRCPPTHTICRHFDAILAARSWQPALPMFAGIPDDQAIDSVIEHVK